MTGTYIYNGYLVHYSANTRKSGDYLVMIRVSLMDPRSGNIVMKPGKEYRDKLNAIMMAKLEAIETKKGYVTQEDKDKAREDALKSESLKVVKKGYLKTKSKEAVQKKVKEIAEELYNKYVGALIDAHKQLPGELLSLPQLAHTYGDKFIACQGRVSEKTRRKKESNLKKVCMKFGSLPVGKIGQREIKKVFKDFGKDASTQLKILEKFLAYCTDMGVIQIANPFSIFLHENQIVKKKNTAQLQKKAVALNSLPVKVEKILNDAIAAADPRDPLMTGLLLVKEMGMSATEACALRWSDIYFYSDGTAKIRTDKDDLIGATHLFLRPCSRLLSRELRRRYDAVATDTDGKFVLMGARQKAVTPKALTAFCRTQLLHAGIGYAYLQRDRGEPGGIGIRLLQKNYAYRLAHICGLGQDSGAVKFLQAQSLAGNTTADHYRSFTSEDGQFHLHHAIDRDGRFKEPPADTGIKKRYREDGTIEIDIPPTDCERFTNAEIVVVLQPGESITISSDCGLSGSVSAAKLRKTKLKTLSDEEENGQIKMILDDGA